MILNIYFDKKIEKLKKHYSCSSVMWQASESDLSYNKFIPDNSGLREEIKNQFSHLRSDFLYYFIIEFSKRFIHSFSFFSIYFKIIVQNLQFYNPRDSNKQIYDIYRFLLIQKHLLKNRVAEVLALNYHQVYIGDNPSK